MKKPRKHFVIIIGTRPTAIKLAPVYFEAKKQGLNPVIISTGQHTEMTDQALGAFGLKSNEDLEIMSKKQSLTQITTRVLEKLPSILAKYNPSMVAIPSDPPSDLAAALVGYYLKIPVAHIESGLRTYDKHHPFPEEVVRLLVDHISDLHFAPTQETKENLLKENFKSKTITITGNTGIDALAIMMKKEKLKRNKRVFKSSMNVLLTTHRRESWGKHIGLILKAVASISKKFPVNITYLVHPNPVIQSQVDLIFKNRENVKLTPPASYSEMVHLLAMSDLIITDSGGIQEEATYLGIPTLVVREKTERKEGVRAGVLKVIGRQKQMIIKEVTKLLTDEKVYKKMARPSNVYGDGHASKKIIKKIKYYLYITKNG